MDGLETRDDRRIMPRTCFSIEPGIYLPEFGVRSEVNVYIDKAGKVHVTGGARCRRRSIQSFDPSGKTLQLALARLRLRMNLTIAPSRFHGL